MRPVIATTAVLVLAFVAALVVAPATTLAKDVLHRPDAGDADRSPRRPGASRQPAPSFESHCTSRRLKCTSMEPSRRPRRDRTERTALGVDLPEHAPVPPEPAAHLV